MDKVKVKIISSLSTESLERDIERWINKLQEIFDTKRKLEVEAEDLKISDLKQIDKSINILEND